MPCIRPGAGLLFCPDAIQPHTSVYSVFCAVRGLYRQRHKTVHKALQALFLPFAVFCCCCVAGASIHIALPASRWSVSQRRNTSSVYQDTRRHAGRCTAQRSRPIIIRYIMAQHIADHASPAACNLAPGQQSGRGGLTPSTRRGSPAAGSAAGGAEPLAASAVALFGLSPDS